MATNFDLNNWNFVGSGWLRRVSTGRISVAGALYQWFATHSDTIRLSQRQAISVFISLAILVHGAKFPLFQNRKNGGRYFCCISLRRSIDMRLHAEECFWIFHQLVFIHANPQSSKITARFTLFGSRLRWTYEVCRIKTTLFGVHPSAKLRRWPLNREYQNNGHLRHEADGSWQGKTKGFLVVWGGLWASTPNSSCKSNCFLSAIRKETLARKRQTLAACTASLLCMVGSKGCATELGKHHIRIYILSPVVSVRTHL